MPKASFEMRLRMALLAAAASLKLRRLKQHD